MNGRGAAPPPSLEEYVKQYREWMEQQKAAGAWYPGQIVVPPKAFDEAERTLFKQIYNLGHSVYAELVDMQTLFSKNPEQVDPSHLESRAKTLLSMCEQYEAQYPNGPGISDVKWAEDVAKRTLEWIEYFRKAKAAVTQYLKPPEFQLPLPKLPGLPEIKLPGLPKLPEIPWGQIGMFFLLFLGLILLIVLLKR